MTTQPIGVIDSGIGGLTVWRELIHIMPQETYLYFGDSGFCPYGSKTAPDITSTFYLSGFIWEKSHNLGVAVWRSCRACPHDGVCNNQEKPYNMIIADARASFQHGIIILGTKYATLVVLRERLFGG